MAERAVLHSDLNSFYASVEMMLNPDLRGKAVAVCGSAEERHGIILAKSELAKKAGVKTGMANWQARQCCKDLILVPPQYDEYIKYSRLTRAIYSRYTDLIEPFGMDECWCDVTAARAYGSPPEIAEEIRKSVREELGLTVSVGVSFNKIYAKLGSDMKKPDAVTVITRENFREKVWPLHCSELLYCGRATTRKLEYYGIHTIGDIAESDPAFLKWLLGVNGVALWTFAAGLDTSRVMPAGYEAPVKSVGHGITCVADLLNEEEVYRVMLELSQDVGHRLRVHGLAARGVQVWVRCSDLGGCQYQCRLPAQTQLPADFANAGFRLFKERYRWQRYVRALCVRAIDLVPQETPDQLSFFDDPARRRKREALQDAVEEIRSRFGKRSVTYASLTGDLKMPDDGRDMVRMPSLMYQ